MNFINWKGRYCSHQNFYQQFSMTSPLIPASEMIFLILLFHLLQVFDELLLDADFSVNAGSWMWLSCSAFFQQFFHCYCPVGFGRRTDPSGDFVRWAYCPVLLLSSSKNAGLAFYVLRESEFISLFIILRMYQSVSISAAGDICPSWKAFPHVISMSPGMPLSRCKRQQNVSLG